MAITINGSGTVTGISAGGLPDASVTPADLSQPLTLGTSQAATGTSVDFTGIPSWVKRITVMFNGVSTNGTSSLLIRIGDSGGFSTSGYQSSVIGTITSSSSVGASSAGYLLGSASATNQCIGSIVINLCATNNWISSGSLYFSDTQMNSCAGAKTLSGTLDRIRITTVNGTDTFDSGSINILYE